MSRPPAVATVGGRVCHPFMRHLRRKHVTGVELCCGMSAGWEKRACVFNPHRFRLPGLAFEGADIDDAAAVPVAVPGSGDTALIPGGGAVVVAVVDGLAASQRGVREGGAAVVLQRAEFGV